MVKRTTELSRMSDLELRKLVLDGDEMASLCLFKRYHSEIRNFIVSRGCEGDDADDVTIISLQKIWKSMSTYDENSEASFNTWALTIAKNTYLDWSKTYNSQVLQSTDNWSPNAADDTTPETLIVEKERQAYVESLLGQLSEFEQRLLLMRGAGMKYEEIAKELDVTLQVVKNRIHQAKIKLVNLSKDARKD
ncbi:MAG: RNA polymerase sigma factor [Bacteroidales bacterium]|nr:RNA polymerase sigma factor [Bacteroidales bacterium]